MKSRIALIALVVMLLAAGVAFVSLRSRSNEDPVMQKEAAAAPRQEADERGPRPTATRLREGAVQIEDRSRALASAEKSLARLEQEIASADDTGKRTSLERKKQLVEHAIARLKK
jgi:hypothetical protein